MQKELQDILTAIEIWSKVNNNDVTFIFSCLAFDEKKIAKAEKDIIKDGSDNISVYGSKDMIKILLDDLMIKLKKEKEDFINV